MSHTLSSSTSSPSLHWQFPDTIEVTPYGKSDGVSRYPSLLVGQPPSSFHNDFYENAYKFASSHPSEVSVCSAQAIFQVKRYSGQNTEKTWLVSLKILTTGELNQENEHRVFDDTVHNLAMLPVAVVLWTKCYLTSDTTTRLSLYKVFGSSFEFDGLIAKYFLINQVFGDLDELIKYTLDAAIKDGDELAVGSVAQRRLLAELVASMSDIQAKLLGRTDFIPDAKEHGMPVWDARLADWIEQIGAKSIAEDVRSRGRVAAGQGGPAFWAKWLPGPNLPPLRRLALAALALWRIRVRPLLELEAQSKPLRIESVVHEGDSYTPLPKITAPISWAFGAPGTSVKEVGGDHYAQEPSFIEDATLLPRSWRLLPAEHTRRPHQTALPIDDLTKTSLSVTQGTSVLLPGEYRGDALPVAIAGSQGYVLSPYAAKLALLMLASPQVKAGEIAFSKLGELTRLTRPETKRLQARDHEATARGLDELHHLFIFLPDNTKVPVFHVQTPTRPELADPTMVIRYGLTTLFRDALGKAANGMLKGTGLQGREYSGQFLLNLTGTMRLPNNKPTLLRYYMRFAAHWNAAFLPGTGGEFDRSRMQPRTLDEWAAIANALPPVVVKHLEEKRVGAISKNRAAQLSIARQRAKEDLTALAKDHGLIKLEEKGNLYLPLPPPAYMQAWRLFRAGASSRT